ncbi:hypothetical protein [Streptomyces sp. NPDC001678]|uniref:hypothetical protein n=1 Tax=Streptomyces sp. NPDC001678 TaxID=3364599 RepID=UPI0036CF8821
MHAPSVPLTAWWAMAVAVTVIFLVVFVPLMPNRNLRIRMCLGPVGMAAFIAAAARLTDTGTSQETALPVYVTVVLAFLVGFIGRWGDLREKCRDYAIHGKRRENSLSRGTWVQLTAAVLVFLPLGVWLTTAST